jgi:hypothetical protein
VSTKTRTAYFPKKRKKVTKRFEIKEKFNLNKQQRDLRLKKNLI